MAVIFNAGTIDLVANVPVDQRTGEFHSASAQVTNFASESGVNLSDHILLDPDTIEISWTIENRDESGSYGTRAATEFEKIKSALRQRQLYDVVTRHYLYKNMALVSINAETTSPFSGKLIGRASFRQFNQTSIEVVSVPAVQLNGSAKQTASSQIDAGKQEGQDVPDETTKSFLAQVLS